ncbi:MAG: ABC transporter permease [Chthonomonas sp.]|nr:ABC transporter permease [Chthonomonas sp.]
MNFWDAFKVAIDMLRVHKLRAFLTMLGVIIGVMSVSLIVLAMSAFQTYVSDQFSRIGSDTIFVMFRPGREGQFQGDVDALNVSDIDFIRARVPEIEIASGYREAGKHDLRSGITKLEDASVKGIDQNFVALNTVELLEGRHISEQDQTAKASVAVISEDVRNGLFPDGHAIGKIVQLDGLTVEIIGVAKNLELMGERDTKVMFIPLATANSKWLGGDKVDLILMRAKKGLTINKVMDKIWESLMLRSGGRPIYNVESSENILKIFQNILGVIGMILSGIAALSLLVGGIGVMNIMLVSVTERTREIGLRKAVGAKPIAIMTQFLIESASLTLMGGLIGMAIAWGFGNVLTVVTMMSKWPREGGLAAPFPMGAAIGSMIFSALIGVVFGFYPAARAAKLHPIEALRSE